MIFDRGEADETFFRKFQANQRSANARLLVTTYLMRLIKLARYPEQRLREREPARKWLAKRDVDD